MYVVPERSSGSRACGGVVDPEAVELRKAEHTRAMGDLRDAFLRMRAFGMRGVNVTSPHKASAIEYLDEIALDAATIGEVNTVRRAGARLIGENTDGKGFLGDRSIPPEHVVAAGKSLPKIRHRRFRYAPLASRIAPSTPEWFPSCGGTT
jgi:hypothetical protein